MESDNPRETASSLSAEEAQRMLAEVDAVMDRIISVERFPKWWLAVYALLPALAISLPLLVPGKWSSLLVTVAGLAIAWMVVFWLAWPRLTRTGLGRDERLLMKGTLTFPWIFFPQFHQVFYHELQGHELLVVALALVLPALFHLVCGIAILRWYRRRIRARAFDFTESEAIWDSAQREIDRRLREIDACDRAQRAARRNPANPSTPEVPES